PDTRLRWRCPEDRHRSNAGSADLPAGIHLGGGLARRGAGRRTDPGLSLCGALRGSEAQIAADRAAGPSRGWAPPAEARRRQTKESAMAARTGAEYIKGLQSQECEVWLRGERVKDVTTHPGLANGVRAIASLYDLQHELSDEMTYVSPTSGERLGLSFIIPRTRDELARRGAMMPRWARTTCGMMGRSPDFMNDTFPAWAAAARYSARRRPHLGPDMRRYHACMCAHQLTLTHPPVKL